MGLKERLAANRKAKEDRVQVEGLNAESKAQVMEELKVEEIAQIDQLAQILTEEANSAVDQKRQEFAQAQVKATEAVHLEAERASQQAHAVKEEQTKQLGNLRQEHQKQMEQLTADLDRERSRKKEQLEAKRKAKREKKKQQLAAVAASEEE